MSGTVEAEKKQSAASSEGLKLILDLIDARSKTRLAEGQPLDLTFDEDNKAFLKLPCDNSTPYHHVLVAGGRIAFISMRNGTPTTEFLELRPCIEAPYGDGNRYALIPMGCAIEVRRRSNR